MRRAIRQVAIFGLLGVVVSYGVAWGVVCVPSLCEPDSTAVTGMSPVGDFGMWTVESVSRGGYDGVYSQRRVGGTSVLMPSTDPAPPRTAESVIPSWAAPILSVGDPMAIERGFPGEVLLSSDLVARFGWPCRCAMFQASVLSSQAGGAAAASPTAPAMIRRETLHGVLDLRGRLPRVSWGAFEIPQWLPLRPVWSGLLLNAAFYGGSLGAVWFGIGWTRRGVRRRGGRCVGCGYDLRGRAEGGAVCPECGTRVPGVGAIR